MTRCPVGLLCLLVAACETGPNFGAPVTVVAGHAANPTVAVDPRGGVYVAWVQTEPDSTTNAYVARAPRGGGFERPVRLNDRPGEVMLATQNPAQVQVGGDGTVYVAWVSDRAPPASRHSDVSVRLVRSTDGGRSFSAPVTLAVDLGRRWPANMYYDLASAGDGSLYVSWLDLHYYSDSLAARAIRHAADSTPVPEDRVDLRVARSTDGGRTFTQSLILDSSSCICCRTAIAAGPDGNPHVLWRHVFPGSVRDFYAASSYDRGRTFSAPVRVHDDGWVLDGCPDIGPDIVVDQRNVVHAAWYTGAPSRQGLWYAPSRDGGAHFDDPVALLTDRYVPPSEVKLASLGARAWIVWEDRRTAPGQIRFVQAGRRRSVSLGVGEFPTIAAGGDRLAAAWVANSAVRVRVAEMKTGPR